MRGLSNANTLVADPARRAAARNSIKKAKKSQGHQLTRFFKKLVRISLDRAG